LYPLIWLFTAVDAMVFSAAPLTMVAIVRERRSSSP
jgi:hypothetical protein